MPWGPAGVNREPLFNEIQCRSFLLSLHEISLSEDPEVSEELRTILKNVRRLRSKYDQDQILEYHSHDFYSDYLFDNRDRLRHISVFAVELWEPFNKFRGQTKLPPILNKLNSVRSRHSHSLSNPPTSSGEIIKFHYELKTLDWKFDDWVQFAYDCLEAMKEFCELSPSMEFSNPEDLVSAASQARHKLEHHRADLQSTIDFITSPDEWSLYIDVMDSKDRIAIDRLAFLLDQKKSNFVVQICGEGGLGKTALMREFVRRNVDGPVENLYEKYLIISSKSKSQGEVKTTPGVRDTFLTNDPNYPRKGPLRYAKDLSFREFLRIIAAHSSSESDDVETVKQEIERNNFLIVLDNFEDCSDKDKQRYFHLFDSLESGCRSRIIITGRKEESPDDIKTIRLSYLSSSAASELLFKRYLYLYEHHSAPGIWDFKNSIYDALNEVRHIDYISKLSESISIAAEGTVDRLDPVVFRNRTGHPLVILRMAVEMGRPTLPNIPGWLTEMNAEERVISILTHIAKSDGFQKWERDVSQWVTTKAYDDIQHHNECVLVLMRLLDGSADLSELKEHVRAENGDVERVEDAVQRLLSHQILIRRRKDGRYEAAEQAKSHILPVLDDPSPKEATPTKIADSIEQLLDQILASIVKDNNVDAIGHINRLLGMDTSLENRKALTKQSYTLMTAILLHITAATERQKQMALSFAKAAAALLESQDSQSPRPNISELLFRGLVTSQADPLTFHMLTRSLNTSDIRSMPQATQTLFVPYTLRVIQETPDIYPLYLADLLSILAALGAHSSALQKTMAPAWRRILTHPNVKHGEFMSGVEADSRVLLFRMAQNDEEWVVSTASLLNLYQAEREKESWEGVLNWSRYALPPHAPEADHLSKVHLPTGFVPGKNGLSFDTAIGGYAVFQVIEKPVLFANESTHKITEEASWPKQKREMFRQRVSSWFAGKIREQPNGFGTVEIANFIHQEFGRAKEVIPLASNGVHKTIRSWMENHILSEDRYREYHIEAFSQTKHHLVVKRRNQTKNLNHWLFDDTSASAPNLPLAKDMPMLLRTLEGAVEISLSNLGVSYITFRENYAKHLHAKGMMATLMDFEQHLIEMQAFVLERAEEAVIDKKEIQQLLQEWESKARKFVQKSGLLYPKSKSSSETKTNAVLTKKQKMRSRGLDLSRRSRRGAPNTSVQEEE